MRRILIGVALVLVFAVAVSAAAMVGVADATNTTKTEDVSYKVSGIWIEEGTEGYPQMQLNPDGVCFFRSSYGATDMGEWRQDGNEIIMHISPTDYHFELKDGILYGPKDKKHFPSRAWIKK